MRLNGVEAWSPPTGFTVELTAAGRAWDAVRVPSRIGRSVIERLGDDSGAVIEDACTSSMAIIGLRTTPVRPEPCPCDHELPQP